MPFSRITLNFEIGNDESQFIDDFHTVMVETFQIPHYDRLVHLMEATRGFYQPTNCTGRYALFEITLFSGRSIETKRKLYKKLCELAERYGVSCDNTRIILLEEPKENWGVRGGQAACDLNLGFKTNV